MIDIFLWVGAFIASISVLLKASDIFTDNAEKIGLFFRLPAFIIGVTIFAFGTSLPELVSSVFAVIGNNSEIVSGTVVGSNIANIFLILGVVAIIGKKMKLNYEILNVDLPILMASAFLLAVMIFDGEFTFAEAILSLIGLLIYLVRSVTMEDDKAGKAGEKRRKMEANVKSIFDFRRYAGFPWRNFFMLLLSCGFIFVSAKYTIDSAVRLSSLFNLTKEVIGATIIAFGTSLPELAVSFTAAQKGKAEIAVGNILGSNIFNVLGVMGIAGLFGTLIVPMSIVTFSLPIMILATVLYLFVTQDKEITSWEGGFLLIFYVLFIGKMLGFI